MRARLQFVRELKEHFLEVNVQGKLMCKVRGYGQVDVDWFRKTPSGLIPIQRPNQVENGVLIFQYVQKQDAGEYVCVARSNYRSSEIQMNVKVIVGGRTVTPILYSTSVIYRVLLMLDNYGLCRKAANLGYELKPDNTRGQPASLELQGVWRSQAAD